MTPDVPELINDAKPVTRERIMDLQDHLAAMPQLDLPVRHFFANGLYGRELYVPAGVCAVGKIHKHEQITVVMGDCTMVTPGEEPVHIVGYHISSTPAGVKRAVYAHTDTFITSFHPNPDNLRDMEKVEAFLIAPSFEALVADTMLQLEEPQ